MKYCTKCGAELSDDAALCPRCNFPAQVDTYTFDKPSKKTFRKKSVAGLVFGLLGFILPLVCTLVFALTALMNISSDVFMVLLGVLVPILFVGILILAILAVTLPFLNSLAIILAAILMVIIFGVSIVLFLFSCVKLPIALFTVPLILILSVITLVAGLAGIAFSIVAIVKKSKWGIAGIIVSSLSVVSVIVIDIIAIIASILSAISPFIPMIVISLLFSIAGL